MRAQRIFTDILEWRWTPAVGLALGALTYVSLALLVIPDRIGDEERATSRVGAFQALRNRTSAFAASIAPSLTDSDSRNDPAAMHNVPSPQAPVAPATPTPVNEANFPRRGFTPPLERAEPPPPPPPPPAPPEPVVVQPPPPPAEPPAAPAPPPAPVDSPPPPPPTLPPDGQAAPPSQPPPQPGQPGLAPLPETPPGQNPPAAPIPPH